MKNKHIIILVFLISFMLVSCAKKESLIIKTTKITEENKKFYDLGLTGNMENYGAKIYEIETIPSDLNKNVNISLLKSSEDMKKWEEVNSINRKLKGNDFIGLLVDKDNKQFFVKIVGEKDNKTEISWPLNVDKQRSLVSSSMVEDRGVTISKKGTIIFSFILSDKENIAISELKNIEEDLPTDVNQFVVVLRSNK